MKTLNSLLSEAKIKLNPVKVQWRKDSKTSYNDTVYKGAEPIGWFSNKNNMAAGWVIFPLDAGDKKWFKDQKASTDMVYRIASGKGTSLVKINLKSNRILYFDNATYVETDKISWEKRWYAWEILMIDGTTRAFKAFNTDGEYR